MDLCIDARRLDLKFSHEVRSWLEGLIAKTKKSYTLRVDPEVTIRGKSGNSWKVDYSIAEKQYAVEGGQAKEELVDRIVFEVKAYGEKGSNKKTDYRVLLLLAYAQLADLPNDLPKFVIIPHHAERRRSSGFDYQAYFFEIGATLIDYSDPKDRTIVEEAIADL